METNKRETFAYNIPYRGSEQEEETDEQIIGEEASWLKAVVLMRNFILVSA